MTTAAAQKIHVEAEHLVKAPADQVYRYISDYREHHPHFLPKAFSNLVVEKGGVGTGTVMTFNLRIARQTTRMRVTIDEPDPGKVLKEISLESDHVTTFEVFPQGDVCRVRIHTEWTPAGGLQGWMERRFAPRMLTDLFKEELINLDLYAGSHVAAHQGYVTSGVAGFTLL